MTGMSKQPYVDMRMRILKKIMHGVDSSERRAVKHEKASVKRLEAMDRSLDELNRLRLVHAQKLVDGASSPVEPMRVLTLENIRSTEEAERLAEIDVKREFTDALGDGFWRKL